MDRQARVFQGAGGKTLLLTAQLGREVTSCPSLGLTTSGGCAGGVYGNMTRNPTLSKGDKRHG